MLAFAAVVILFVCLPLVFGRFHARRIGDPSHMQARGVALGLAAALPTWIGVLIAHRGGVGSDWAWAAAILWTTAVLSLISGYRAGFAVAARPLRHLGLGLAVAGLVLFPVKEVLTPVALLAGLIASIVVDNEERSRLPAWWPVTVMFCIAAAFALFWLPGADHPRWIY